MNNAFKPTLNSSALPMCYFALLLFLGACGKTSDPEKKLPILGRKELAQQEIKGDRNHGTANSEGSRTAAQDTIYHTIADFEFINQDSSVVSHKTFENKIYVADFFFTSCPTICPVMKSNMLQVYEAFKDNEEVLLLSHSIDPEYDTVALLKDYSERLGVTSEKWHFVTGDKEAIFDIGQGSYMVTAMEDDKEPGGFLHSGAFILVDKKRRVRGIYDGTQEEAVDKLINDIPILLAENE